MNIHDEDAADEAVAEFQVRAAAAVAGSTHFPLMSQSPSHAALATIACLRAWRIRA